MPGFATAPQPNGSKLPRHKDLHQPL
ncbi:hypothetical protein J2W53_000973 [Pseudomonas frederiksbergensis]|nr:hypothetical protein [Pseudomonas frederiksbergensis]